MKARQDPRGRKPAAEHWTQALRSTMETPAWRAMSLAAQMLHLWLKLEWHGPKANNNGKIRLSVRDAAARLGVGKDKAARAFQELQAKGFLVITEPACLGFSGSAKGPSFEVTEIAMPGRTEGRKLFRDWRSGADFPVVVASPNNPSGANGKQDPVIEPRTPCHRNEDRNPHPCHQNEDTLSSE